MATYTSKLNLKKPTGAEHVSRQDMNDNYDKIDANVVTNTDGEISNSLLIGALKSNATIGQYSLAQGNQNEASGSYAHAEGWGTTASYYCCHAEGKNTTASGDTAHAEGYATTASGQDSHTEGYTTTASGMHSHAEGDRSTSSGKNSHAEGYKTTASGDQSHVEGYVTTAQRRSQHVFGEFNVLDSTGTASSRGSFVEIVGNGTEDNIKSNARALDWDGNEYLMGDLYIGCDADSTGGEKISTDPFTGATSAAAGSKGYVPAPSAGDQTKFLRADGTWGNVDGASDMIGATASTAGEHGLVPAPAAGDQTKFLSGAGTWEPVGGASDMTGATASTAGVHGLVPAPAAGDQDKVLKGDGTWGTVQSVDLTPLQDGLAIIVNGDTCSTAVPVGGFAYIKNNTHGLSEGLYKNTSASAFPTSGGTASSSVFTKVSGGGLNALNNNFYIGSGMTYVAVSPQTVAQNSSYTAPEDGFYSISVSATDGSTSAGFWYLDSDRSIRLVASVPTLIITIPLKAGTTIYTRKNYGEYKVYGYLKW